MLTEQLKKCNSLYLSGCGASDRENEDGCQRQASQRCHNSWLRCDWGGQTICSCQGIGSVCGVNMENGTFVGWGWVIDDFRLSSSVAYILKYEKSTKVITNKHSKAQPTVSFYKIQEIWNKGFMFCLNAECFVFFIQLSHFHTSSSIQVLQLLAV